MRVNRFLIVVRKDAFAGLPHVSLVPVGDGWAFLAFPPNETVDSLELALIDQLEAGLLPAETHRRFASLRDALRAWRRDAGLVFRERAIVVVERKSRAQKRGSSS